MILGEEGDEALLGVITLEEFGFMLKSVHRDASVDEAETGIVYESST